MKKLIIFVVIIIGFTLIDLALRDVGKVTIRNVNIKFPEIKDINIVGCQQINVNNYNQDRISYTHRPSIT